MFGYGEYAEKTVQDSAFGFILEESGRWINTPNPESRVGRARRVMSFLSYLRVARGLLAS